MVPEVQKSAASWPVGRRRESLQALGGGIAFPAVITDDGLGHRLAHGREWLW